MIITVVNHTKSIKDDELLFVIRAINRQIEEDFRPYWHMHAVLRLEGASTLKPDTAKLPDMRGDAILYMWDGKSSEDALGYHDANHRGVPYGFVFPQLSKELDEPWSVTLSHEALELLGDPEVNLLVLGAHPGKASQGVFHWFEMCDAVQAETYEIDAVRVSNFVLPLYFTGDNESGSRNDFLGTRHGSNTLRSFGINPGGYIGFYNPESGDHETVARDGDAKAQMRLDVKAKFGRGRRGARYQRSVAAGKYQKQAPVDGGVKILRRTKSAEAAAQRRE